MTALTRVGDVHRTAVVADVHDRLVEVAVRMRDNDAEALVVMDGDKLAGTISERDLVEAVADGVDLEQTVAGDLTTVHMVTVDVDTPLDEARRVLANANTRHLVVMAGDTVVGTVSARDLLRPEGTDPEP